jgi:hypothetical protein
VASGDNFPTTSQPLVRDAVAGLPSARNRLSHQYWRPIHRLFQRLGAIEPEDLTQKFFTAKFFRVLATFDPQRGCKLSTLLFRAVQNCLKDDFKERRRLRRNRGVAPRSLETEEGDLLEPVNAIDAERLYIRDCAVERITRTFDALREQYRQRGEESLFDALLRCLIGANDQKQRDVAAQLGVSEVDFNNALHKLRKDFCPTLRAVVALEVSPDQVDEEIRNTFDILRERIDRVERVRRTLDALREQYGHRGEARLFDELRPCLTGADDQTRRVAAEGLGVSEVDFGDALGRFRNDFYRTLRNVVALEVSPDQVDEEVRRTLEALRKRGSK